MCSASSVAAVLTRDRCQKEIITYAFQYYRSFSCISSYFGDRPNEVTLEAREACQPNLKPSRCPPHQQFGRMAGENFQICEPAGARTIVWSSSGFEALLAAWSRIVLVALIHFRITVGKRLSSLDRSQNCVPPSKRQMLLQRLLECGMGIACCRFAFAILHSKTRIVCIG